jgi:hypothetical protein
VSSALFKAKAEKYIAKNIMTGRRIIIYFQVMKTFELQVSFSCGCSLRLSISFENGYLMKLSALNNSKGIRDYSKKNFERDFFVV